MKEKLEELPFPHELIAIGYWLLFFLAIIAVFDPADKHLLYVLLSGVIGLFGAFIPSIILISSVDHYYDRIIGKKASNTHPTPVVFGLLCLCGLILTGLLLKTGVPTSLTETILNQEIGNDPLGRGRRGVMLVTTSVCFLTVELVLAPLLHTMGVTVVKEPGADQPDN